MMRMVKKRRREVLLKIKMRTKMASLRNISRTVEINSGYPIITPDTMRGQQQSFKII